MMVALLSLLLTSMLSAGLGLGTRGASRPPAAAMVALVVANLIVLPLFALGLMELVSLSAATRLALWLCVLSAGGASSPAIIAAANGEVASSGPMVLVLAVTGGVVTTIFVASSVVTTLALVVAQFLPMFVGSAIARWAPARASRLRRPMSGASLIALVSVIVGFLFEQGRAVATQSFAGLASGALLVAASMACGWALLASWPSLQAPAAFTSGIRNLSLALVVSPPELPEVSAGILAYGLVMYVASFGTAVAVRAHRSRVRGVPADGVLRR